MTSNSGVFLCEMRIEQKTTSGVDILAQLRAAARNPKRAELTRLAALGYTQTLRDADPALVKRIREEFGVDESVGAKEASNRPELG